MWQEEAAGEGNWEAVPKGAVEVEPRVAGVGKAPGSASRWR